MNLTAEESARAAAQGWQLCEVYDLDKGKCTLQLLPTDFSRASQADVVAAITQRAKSGDALAIKALTVVAKSNLYKRK